MGLALWHFTIFIPDRFWAGIVGAFLGSVFGAILFGLVVNGFTVPGQDDTNLFTVLQCVPGSILGVAFVPGSRRSSMTTSSGRASALGSGFGFAGLGFGGVLATVVAPPRTGSTCRSRTISSNSSRETPRSGSSGAVRRSPRRARCFGATSTAAPAVAYAGTTPPFSAAIEARRRR